MVPTIGIRREDKNEWERRVPVIPLHVNRLKEVHGVHTVIQRSSIRIFADEAYRAAGAQVSEDLSDCAAVFAIKEIPPALFRSGKTYVFFSHTIKGQAYNIPMLKRMMELRCQLIDYERIINAEGKRLVAFGRFAGIVAMIDTLWALGRRLSWKGIKTPFTKLKRAFEYTDSEAAKQHIRAIGEEISQTGLDGSLIPFICGFAGYGNVSGGAQEIFDCLPCKAVDPAEIAKGCGSERHMVYKMVFKEEHTVKPVGPGNFDLMDYYHHPEKYRSNFYVYAPHLTILMNCIYWERKYPRLLTKDYLEKLFSTGTQKLEIIGDISCDIEGAIECTSHATDPGGPVYVYDPLSRTSTDGYRGVGVVIMAVDNLPCEIPAEASVKFSDVLMPFIPEIAYADYGKSFRQWSVSKEIRDATILYHGELTPKYRYLKQYLG
jgi:saccharopine dehydrogenase (NAD+, L-lysine-forming)